MSLRNIVESMRGGKAALASARLRRQVLRALDVGMASAGLTQAHLARRLGKSRSAVNQVLTGDGNLRIETLAEYLEAMGCEVVLSIRATGAHATSAPAPHPSAVQWAAVSTHEASSPDGAASEYEVGILNAGLTFTGEWTGMAAMIAERRAGSPAVPAGLGAA